MLQNIIKSLVKGTMDDKITAYKEFKNKVVDFIIKTDDKNRIIIPDSISEKIFPNLHYSLGRPGHETYINTIKEYFTCNNFVQNVKKVIKSCLDCLVYKNSNKKYGFVKGKIATTQPLKHLSTDVLGPFKTKHFKTKQSSTKFFILNILDRCTRFTKIYKIENFSFEQFSRCFVDWFKNLWNSVNGFK